MSDKNRASRLKRLETRQREAEAEISEQRRLLREKESVLANKQQELQETKRKIQSLKDAKGLIVTEHAILRYLVRVEGMDLQEVKEKILTSRIQDAYNKLRSNGKFPSGTGFRVVIRNGKIVTVEN